MIGDRKHDVVGAAEHGIRTVGVANGMGGEAELTEAGAWRVVPHLDALADWLVAGEW